MSLTLDAHDFIQDQIDKRVQNSDLHGDLSGGLMLLTEEAKIRVAELLARNINSTSTIDLEELLLEPV